MILKGIASCEFHAKFLNPKCLKVKGESLDEEKARLIKAIWPIKQQKVERRD
jgi:hypothetical protein